MATQEAAMGRGRVTAGTRVKAGKIAMTTVKKMAGLKMFQMLVMAKSVVKEHSRKRAVGTRGERKVGVKRATATTMEMTMTTLMNMKSISEVVMMDTCFQLTTQRWASMVKMCSHHCYGPDRVGQLPRLPIKWTMPARAQRSASARKRLGGCVRHATSRWRSTSTGRRTPSHG